MYMHIPTVYQPNDLTLTRVVFELENTQEKVKFHLYLTLTRVVFE